ncbi:MAG: exodeoxyribonuclease alpha subunit [Acidimicrobiales bacterium]|nr:exodeoxyribonuclease alpha subunit [Acidimicrobiales bacterium]
MIGLADTCALTAWTTAGVLQPAEVHGAAVLVRSDPAADDILLLAAAMALWAPLHGHACIDLADVAGMAGAAVARGAADALEPGDRSTAAARVDALPWPTLTTWLDALRSTPLCRVVTPGATIDEADWYDDCPLVLDGNLLYTQRQWIDERTVAERLLRRCAAPAASSLTAEADAVLTRLLPPEIDGAANPQHRAARTALGADLAVIVGGPGTGKTHTIARLLVAMLRDADVRGAPLRIALAAPTGKAAARMAEALQSAMESLAGDASLARTLDILGEVQPTTIHRLLGGRGQRTRFVHGPARPLDADVVVIDEASMVALPLMARLVDALRPGARLVLVGDPDQLESIEVGSVLADIVDAADTPGSAVAAHVVRLTRPHRQEAGSPIGPLADLIRDGRVDDVVATLRRSSDTSSGAIAFVDTGAIELGHVGAAQVDRRVGEAILEPLRAAAVAATAGDATTALAELAEVRVLCAHRVGPHGSQRWNRTIESWLREGQPAQRDYAGRPLLATRNDQRQRIANGDTGVIIDTPGGRRAAFRTGGGLRLFAPAQLDDVETAYATTVHKSQGSEYDTVVVVLPPATSPLIGRELLYTAITRARRRVLIIGSMAAVIACTNSPARRVTGLGAALGTPAAPADASAAQ